MITRLTELGVQQEQAHQFALCASTFEPGRLVIAVDRGTGSTPKHSQGGGAVDRGRQRFHALAILDSRNLKVEWNAKAQWARPSGWVSLGCRLGRLGVSSQLPPDVSSCIRLPPVTASCIQLSPVAPAVAGI